MDPRILSSLSLIILLILCCILGITSSGIPSTSLILLSAVDHVNHSFDTFFFVLFLEDLFSIFQKPLFIIFCSFLIFIILDLYFLQIVYSVIIYINSEGNIFLFFTSCLFSLMIDSFMFSYLRKMMSLSGRLSRWAVSAA